MTRRNRSTGVIGGVFDRALLFVSQHCESRAPGGDCWIFLNDFRDFLACQTFAQCASLQRDGLRVRIFVARSTARRTRRRDARDVACG
jgi:hypothetical protein